MRCEIRMFI